MIYLKLYFLIVLLISCLTLGLGLFIFDIGFWMLKIILASGLLSIPLSIGTKIIFGERLNEVFRRDN